MSTTRLLKEVLDDIAALPEGDDFQLHSKTTAGSIRFMVADSPESERHMLNLAEELHEVLGQDSPIVTTTIIRGDTPVWQANTRKD